MTNLRMVGLAALAVASLMAVAGTASATTLTSPKETTYTGAITATSEGHIVFKGSFGIEVHCNSHVKGKVESHGGATVSGPIEELSFTGCTNGYSVSVLNKGSLSINGAGEVTAYDTEFTMTTPTAINCTYRMAEAGTKLGTLTDSGKTATVDLNASFPRIGHSFFCGSSGALAGSYIVSTPDSLFID